MYACNRGSATHVHSIGSCGGGTEDEGTVTWGKIEQSTHTFIKQRFVGAKWCFCFLFKDVWSHNERDTGDKFINSRSM